MRRTNMGAARRLSLTHSGQGTATAREPADRGEAAADFIGHVPLSGITVLPVTIARPADEHPVTRPATGGSFVRVADPLSARHLGRRAIEESGADVVLLDACRCRPTVVYRSIVRLRNSGWHRGIVLLIDADDIAIVPIASSIGVADFVLATASREELEARLRRACARPAAAVSNVGQSVGQGIQLHWRTHQVSFEGTTISVTLRELQLLGVFLERGGEVLTAADLAGSAWGKLRQRSGGLAAAYVCSLRKKLAWFGGRFGIQTVRGVGYRFVV